MIYCISLSHLKIIYYVVVFLFFFFSSSNFFLGFSTSQSYQSFVLSPTVYISAKREEARPILIGGIATHANLRSLSSRETPSLRLRCLWWSELSSYYSRDDDRGAMRATRVSDSIGVFYDCYLDSTQLSSYSGSQSARTTSWGMPGRCVDDPRLVGIGGVDLGQTIKDRTLGFGGGRPEPPLPPDASSTLLVEGLPSDCTCQEVSHIFRPFLEYKEVRLVSKEPRHPGGDPLILCLVDFVSPTHAATAMDASQGYIFNEHDRDSVKLRLQFARYPGARSGGGHRGKR